MRTITKSILAITMVICVGVVVGVRININRNNIDDIKSTNSQAAQSDISVVVAAMHAAAWQDGMFRLDEEVQPEQDLSEGGNMPFSTKNLKSAADAVSFLNSKSAASQVVIEEAIASIGTTEAKLLNVQNWHAIQATVPFTYPKNTSYSNGVMRAGGSKRGEAGDIFLVFADPDTEKMVFLRGACANPVIVIPVPNQNEETTEESAETTAPSTTTTTAPETTTTPGTTKPFKDPSKDPVNQGNAPIGGGVNATTGPGAKHDETSHAPSETRVNPPAPTRPATTTAQTTTKPATTSPSTTSESTTTTRTPATTEKQTIFVDSTPPPTTEKGVTPEPVTGETPVPGLN